MLSLYRGARTWCSLCTTCTTHPTKKISQKGPKFIWTKKKQQRPNLTACKPDREAKQFTLPESILLHYYCNPLLVADTSWVMPVMAHSQFPRPISPMIGVKNLFALVSVNLFQTTYMLWATFSGIACLLDNPGFMLTYQLKYDDELFSLINFNPRFLWRDKKNCSSHDPLLANAPWEMLEDM